MNLLNDNKTIMISVCIATYNGELYIRKQLESILAQLTDEDEVIISDDASTDNTLSVIRQMNSPIIHIYINEGKHGYTSNFENALKKAKGDYIFLSDQDDEWLPNKVAICMKNLKESDLVVTDAILVNEAGIEIEPSFYSIRAPLRSYIGNIVKFGYLGCCLAFNRKILAKALPFPEKHKLCTHDNWLFIVAETFYKVRILDERLIYYRRHEHNVSTGGIGGKTSLFFKLHYRIYLLKHLLYLAIKKK